MKYRYSDKNLSKTKILSAFANKNVKIFTELEGKIILEVTNTKDKNQKIIKYNFTSLKLSNNTSHQNAVRKSKIFKSDKLVSYFSLNSIITQESCPNI